MEYLGLGDYLVIASSVLGIEAEVLAKASNLVAGDSALNAPAASFGGVESTLTSRRRPRSSATASLGTTRYPTETSGPRCWR